MKLLTFVFVTILPLLKASQKDWIPIFVVFSGNGKSVGEAWISGKETGSIQADLTNANRSLHLRSHLIDLWSKHNISKIKIELNRNGCMVAWMIFDGKGTTNEDWFRIDKLLASSFDGIKNNTEFSRFKLRVSSVASFAIYGPSLTCDADYDWFVVQDVEGGCPWSQQDKYPFIMYTKNGTPRNFNTDARLADYMVVHVRI